MMLQVLLKAKVVINTINFKIDLAKKLKSPRYFRPLTWHVIR